MALVVEKKSRAFFQASELVVENARPALVKARADDVEKKSRLSFQMSADVVENDCARYVDPSCPSKSPVQFPVLSRKLEEMEVVATTPPVELVERRPERTLVMARPVVVALEKIAPVAKRLVEVALVEVEKLVKSDARVVEPLESRFVAVTSPVLETEKSVVVADAVEEAIAKSVPLTSPSNAWTESLDHGEEVPTPRLPFPEKVARLPVPTLLKRITVLVDVVEFCKIETTLEASKQLPPIC